MDCKVLLTPEPILTSPRATLSWWTHHQHPYWTKTNFRYSLYLPVYNSGHCRAKYPSTGGVYQDSTFLSGDTGCQGWHYCRHYWELFITALAFEFWSHCGVARERRALRLRVPISDAVSERDETPLHAHLFQWHRPKASCHFKWETVLFFSMVLILLCHRLMPAKDLLSWTL